MHLQAFQEAVKACRFCFMCRHLSAVGNVTFRESDTPRGRALVAEALLSGLHECGPDYVETFFRAELSVLCERQPSRIQDRRDDRSQGF